MIDLSKYSQSKQQGFIMIMTLILIVLLTVLALTQISLNTTQTRLAANATENEVSFEKTEGAINEAINLVLDGTYSPASFVLNGNGLYLLDANSASPWKTINWSSSTLVKQSFHGGTSSQAAFIIEKLPSVIQPGQNMKSPTHIYRITSRALGASGNNAVVLQGTMKVQ